MSQIPGLACYQSGTPPRLGGGDATPVLDADAIFVEENGPLANVINLSSLAYSGTLGSEGPTVIEEILERSRAIAWDFRTIAFPTDPLAHLFPRWVDYYRLKAAIAATLQPAEILEIGVRYGYSYAAFKHGCPTAHYVGIDLDADNFGGTKGAIDWARRLAEGTNDEFIVGNTQDMARFPGEQYDLIHVDGQQDGGGSYHDLGLALAQGRYVLVDGYLWTRENCLSVSEFVQRHRDIIEYALLIPGYAGELLLKTDPAHLERERRRQRGEPAAGSESVREHYTSEYFLHDCGGWESFGQGGSKHLTHPRLASLFDLAMAGRPRRLLDLGCGRGEITYQAARQGVRVTAVDYSPAALEIARTCFANEPELLERVDWICGSAADLTLEGEYDAVIAGDLVEHLAPAELERMYGLISRHLAPGGRLIVHTFPNLWYYKYHYARQRRAAAALGAYLPIEPRSRYEKLMHINEQNPRVLRRQLRQHFAHVLLWFLPPEEPAGSLGRRMSRRELAACRDLYAIASQVPVEPAEVLQTLTMDALSAEQAGRVEWRVLEGPLEVAAGERFNVSIQVENGAGTALRSRPPWPVNLSYHWRESSSEPVVVFDGVRSALAPGLPAGAAGEYAAEVLAPAEAGDYWLELTLVQEGVRWFEAARGEPLPGRKIHVKGGGER